MGPQDPKEVTRDTPRDLLALVGEARGIEGRRYPLAHRPGVRRPQASLRDRARGSRCGPG